MEEEADEINIDNLPREEDEDDIEDEGDDDEKIESIAEEQQEETIYGSAKLGSYKIMTKYEYDRLIGARAMMIENNSYVSKHIISIISLRNEPPNSLDIAREELRRARKASLLKAKYDKTKDISKEELLEIGASHVDMLDKIRFPLAVERRRPDGKYETYDIKELVTLEEMERMDKNLKYVWGI